jgi:iron complex transport system permease protein
MNADLGARLRMGFVLPLAVVLLFGVAFLALACGLQFIPLGTVARELTLLCGADGEAGPQGILVELRLLRVGGAVLTGASLGVAGCLLQALLQNPLGSPSVVGASQGASFGASLAIVLGASYAGVLAAAFAGSATAMVLLLLLSRGDRRTGVESLVVTGMAIGLLFAALVGLLRSLVQDEYQLGRMGLWLGGGLWHVSLEQLSLFGPVAVVALALTMGLSRELDLVAMGRSTAQRLGLSARAAMGRHLGLACLLTSIAVGTGGMVAFVGLIVPHAARKLVGFGHRAVLPLSACLGAMLVVVTDMLARTVVPPQELPLTVVTSLVGVPCFLLLLRGARRGDGA